tara:strand:+ start:282 stop:671 length:390 start_codon:yes stop_codon:yes gene_type:complete
MLIDITDNFPNLNRFIIIGDTEYQAFIEKFIGYFLGFFFLAIGIWTWLPKIIDHDQRTRKELSDAINEVKALSGLLPICASCKKIRDDKGYWKKIEEYIQNHSEAKFSHGICPECMNKLYPSLKMLEKK